MVKVILLALLILAVAFVLLCVTILFKKNGRFPNTHVSGSRAMRERGVSCAQSQDYAEQHRQGGVRESLR